MKITIEIPEKIVTLAAATLIAQTDDAEFETAVSDAVKSLNMETFTTDLSELEEKAYPIKLALAMLVIGNKVGEYQRKKDDETITAVREKGMDGFVYCLNEKIKCPFYDEGYGCCITPNYKCDSCPKGFNKTKRK